MKFQHVSCCWRHWHDVCSSIVIGNLV